MIDIDHGTITIHDRTFPAVHVICPADDLTTYGREHRSLYTTTDVYIPCENGALIHVDCQRPGLHNLLIYSRRCEWVVTTPDDALWLPRPLYKGVQWALTPNPRHGIHAWWSCLPDWTAEQIDRIASCTVIRDDSYTPPLEIVSLREAHTLWEQMIRTQKPAA